MSDSTNKISQLNAAMPREVCHGISHLSEELGVGEQHVLAVVFAAIAHPEHGATLFDHALSITDKPLPNGMNSDIAPIVLETTQPTATKLPTDESILDDNTRPERKPRFLGIW